MIIVKMLDMNIIMKVIDFHRLDGPAVIYYYKNGNIREERYYQNDKLHRLKGSAIIKYYKNNTIKEELYYIDHQG